jgi:hypothetical protein
MDAEHETLLFYTDVRWFSKRSLANCVYELRSEAEPFLHINGKHDLIKHYKGVNDWLILQIFLNI